MNAVSDVPGWPARRDTVTRAMLGLLDVELRRRACSWWLVETDLVEVSGPDHRGRLPLAELRHRMTRGSKASWPELVEDHVARQIPAAGSGHEQPGQAPAPRRGRLASRAAGHGSRDDVRLRLRARLVTADEDEAATHGYVCRPFVPGLLEALAVDRRNASWTAGGPPTTDAVTAEDLRRWRLEEAEAFQLGRTNVRAEGPLWCEPLHRDGASFTLLRGASHYASLHALWLTDYVDLDERGALVALPHRHLVAVYPLAGTHRLPAVGELLRFAHHSYLTSPAPLTDQLYWWRGGTLSHQPVRHTADGIHLTPTEELAAAFEELS